MKSLASHYGEFYDKASAITQQGDEDELRLFAGLVPDGKPLRILDLGCAEGRLALALAAKGHRVTAADISPKQLAKVSEKANASGLKVETVECDIEAGHEAFGDARFDAIYLMDVIEHFKNPIAALENLRALLTDEGRLFIHTPNVFTPARAAYYFLRPRKLIDFRAMHRLWDFHFQTYDYMTLEKTLAFLGFRGERLVPTKVTVPFLFRSKLLARLFPFLADTLLLVCRKEAPVDVDALIRNWEEKMPEGGRTPG